MSRSKRSKTDAKPEERLRKRPTLGKLSPVVQRLRGVAASRIGREEYRQHLRRKYGTG